MTGPSPAKSDGAHTEIKPTVPTTDAEDDWDRIEDVLAEGEGDEWQDVEVGLASGAVRFKAVR